MEHLARLCEVHVRELRAAVQAQAGEVLTLSQAAAVSGYSKSQLRALIAGGRLSNVGRKGAPRVARGELPVKAGSRAVPGQAAAAQRGTSSSFDPATAVRRALGQSL